MKIMITGNLGYVGPSVMRHLRAAYPDAVLIGVDKGLYAHCLFNCSVLPESMMNMQYYCDVRDIPGQYLQGIDAIVHLAAISNDPVGNAFEDITFAINHEASVELARKARQAGVGKFIYASSCSIYGFAGEEARQEKSPLNPLTAYAKSKVMAEQGLESLADDSFTVTCLRFATACGASERLRLDLVLNDFTVSACTTGKISIFSDGTPWRPLIHVQDMARAIEWAVKRDPGNGDCFLAVNAGSNAWNYQVKDLADAVAAIVPHVEISVGRDAQPDKRSYKVNFDLFAKLAPDYQPQADLASVIRELKLGVEKETANGRPLCKSRYIRLHMLLEMKTGGLLTEQLEWRNATMFFNAD